MGRVKARYLEQQQYQDERAKALDSFMVHPQCEEMYEDCELILVDATTEGNEEEFRLVKLNGMFYLERWVEESKTWKIMDSLSPNEVIFKLKGASV